MKLLYWYYGLSNNVRQSVQFVIGIAIFFTTNQLSHSLALAIALTTVYTFPVAASEFFKSLRQP